MSTLDKYRQMLMVKNETYKVYPNQDKSFNSSPTATAKPENMQRRIAQLQGSIRVLEKKYKHNLKEGFEDKIKSFKLQAVMERRNMRSSILGAKREVQEEELRERARRAQSLREMEVERLININDRLEERRRRARSKVSKQKELIQSKIREEETKLKALNKEAHDRILEEMKSANSKKVYLDSLKNSRIAKEVEQEKAYHLQKIIQNKQLLERLRNEMIEMSRTQKTLPPVEPTQHSPFVTI